MMSERYIVFVMDASCGLSALVDTSDDGIVIGGSETECNFIAKKLNRLAALEAVCQEIVDNAALEKHSSHFSTAFLKGSEVSERHIAQKLKAVLEEV